MSQVHFKEAHPILSVTDIDSSIQYYTGKLGFDLSFRDCSAPDKYVGVRRDGVELHLQYQREEDMPKPGTLIVRVFVNDPDKLFDEYTNRGVFQSPRNDRAVVDSKPWGTREFSIRDPNGHILVFYRDQ